MKIMNNCFVKWSYWVALLFITMSAGLIIAQPFQVGADDSPFFNGIPENFKSQIKLAIPPEAVVKPIEKRKLLVVNINIRDKKMTSLHALVPYANFAIYSMGVQTGAFETYFTNDTLAFARDILQQFNGIVLNNTVGAFSRLAIAQGIELYHLNRGKVKADVPPEIKNIVADINNPDAVKKELYYGSGFLSASSRKVSIPVGSAGVEITKFNGKKRLINF